MMLAIYYREQYKLVFTIYKYFMEASRKKSVTYHTTDTTIATTTNKTCVLVPHQHVNKVALLQ